MYWLEYPYYEDDYEGYPSTPTKERAKECSLFTGYLILDIYDGSIVKITETTIDHSNKMMFSTDGKQIFFTETIMSDDLIWSTTLYVIDIKTLFKNGDFPAVETYTLKDYFATQIGLLDGEKGVESVSKNTSEVSTLYKISLENGEIVFNDIIVSGRWADYQWPHILDGYVLATGQQYWTYPELQQRNFPKNGFYKMPYATMEPDAKRLIVQINEEYYFFSLQDESLTLINTDGLEVYAF